MPAFSPAFAICYSWLHAYCPTRYIFLLFTIIFSENQASWHNCNGTIQDIIYCNGKTVEANLMTSFMGRHGNDNARVARSEPIEVKNHIQELEESPAFYNEHRLVNKSRIAEITSFGHTFKIIDNILHSIVHNINPHFEINGAGLLYFASYPIIADTCTTAFFKNTPGVCDHDKTYHTTVRDVFYFANCNADDRVIVTLNSAEQVTPDTLKLTTSLHRESDGKLMARVLTVKQK
jgi:probable biosynthetic protein (TIGR04098 family)